MEKRGIQIERRWSREGVDPLDEVDWKWRDARIINSNNEVIFEQCGVEAPTFWSDMAVNVVASKYFFGERGTLEREDSVRTMISRVVSTIAAWGEDQGYFATTDDRNNFAGELCHLLVSQVASFNSPVWFNLGTTHRQQCSACFINSVEDTMESIMDLAKTEALLFKRGSGTGTNLSPLRSKREVLSGGGYPSGPVSFMKGYDAFAGVIKSGGASRRSAKMEILNIDHPDILEFIQCKVEEERKAQILIAAGYDGGIDGEAYATVSYQNANNSVRVTDDFMSSYISGGDWQTTARTTGEVVSTYPARELMREIAKSVHRCGDPGIQYHTEINRWNTCAASGDINASNPCGEFMFLDDSACNLASLNLLKFLSVVDREFQVDDFIHAVRIMITAQDILVDKAQYPTEKIGEVSRRFRPLGLGYANLGALLMNMGLPYDSDEGRRVAAVITALMTGAAYQQSVELGVCLGSFDEFVANKDSVQWVLKQHAAVVETTYVIGNTDIGSRIVRAARGVWRGLVDGPVPAMRNAQVTLIAPTGTISFMMDCATTGIEPELALVKYKKLVGGGQLKMVNSAVRSALLRLGYEGGGPDSQVEHMLNYVEEHGTIEGAPHIRDRHLPVFDCALCPPGSKRSITPMGHIKMVAAVQPHLSGAVSKTVNVAHETTVEEIEGLFVEAWRQGLKAVAIYRDGSKRVQPLEVGGKKESKSACRCGHVQVRRRLPETRESLTHKFSVGGHEGYLIVGLYEDGKPGEIFIRMAKDGSVVGGLVESFALAISMALQYGVPLKVLADKYVGSRFEPSGFTANPLIPHANSIFDYIFRWLSMKYLDNDTVCKEDRCADIVVEERPTADSDAPACSVCGDLMVRGGACYHCETCGNGGGCG